jgi:hypothetical protein
MKPLNILRSLLVLSFISFSSQLAAQKGHKHGHPHKHHHPGAKKAVVVKRSPYRPAKVVVFHPVWRPKYAYSRRWVFFPKYNLYWDNWRNHYVFWNGTIWLSQPTAPAVIVNVNLENEKSKELKEDEDDVDDIYKDNSSHKEEIKE